jgi:hypothetical protein
MLRSSSYSRLLSQLLTLIVHAGVGVEASEDQPNTWHVLGGTNCASAATVSMLPTPKLSAWRAMATWKVGRPFDVLSYAQIFSPLSVGRRRE